MASHQTSAGFLSFNVAISNLIKRYVLLITNPEEEKALVLCSFTPFMLFLAAYKQPTRYSCSAQNEKLISRIACMQNFKDYRVHKKGNEYLEDLSEPDEGASST